jgi:septum formation protein
MVFNNKFILASSSISRSNILKNCGLSFIKIIPICNEEEIKKKMLKKKLSAAKISLGLARLKSQSVSLIKKNKLVVGSDTIINLNGKILNKAKNIKDAKTKILFMSGKSHHIYSSASIYYNNKEIWSKTQKTLIKIRNLSETEIEDYLFKAGKQILNSVGCYQLERLGPNIIKEIKGDFFNVMGFPLFPFLNFLKNYKINKKKL